MLKLETLYRAGLSFSLIAADIGVTRAAAIGKAHRMQLPKRVEIVESKPGRARATTGPPRRRRRTSTGLPMTAKLLPEPEIVPDGDYSCSIYGLVNSSCRYPLWPPNAQHHERFYCGIPHANISVGLSYCRRHAVLCEAPRQR